MNTRDAWNNLTDVLEQTLFAGREDSRRAAQSVAQAVVELVEIMIEEKTGAL